MSRAIPVNKLDSGGHGRRGGEGDERVQRAVVDRRQLAAHRVRRLATCRYVRVLGDDERVETPLLDRPCQRYGVDAVVGHECGDPELHEPLPIDWIRSA